MSSPDESKESEASELVVGALLAELTAGCGQKASEGVAENAIEAGMKAQGQQVRT